MSNEINKAITAGLLAANAVGGLSAQSPIAEVKNDISPNSSYSQQDNRHIYPALTHGIGLDDQLSEAYQTNRENRENERERDADAAGLAQDQAVASGSPEPNPSTQENTSPTAQTQQESNADLASQLGDSSKSKTDSVTEADEASDTIA